MRRGVAAYCCHPPLKRRIMTTVSWEKLTSDDANFITIRNNVKDTNLDVSIKALLARRMQSNLLILKNTLVLWLTYCGLNEMHVNWFLASTYIHIQDDYHKIDICAESHLIGWLTQERNAKLETTELFWIIIDMNMTSFTYILIPRRQKCNLDHSEGLYFDCLSLSHRHQTCQTTPVNIVL